MQDNAKDVLCGDIISMRIQPKVAVGQHTELETLDTNLVGDLLYRYSFLVMTGENIRNAVFGSNVERPRLVVLGRNLKQAIVRLSDNLGEHASCS